MDKELAKQCDEGLEDLPKDLRDIPFTELQLLNFTETEKVHIAQQIDLQNESQTPNNQFQVQIDATIATRDQETNISSYLKQNESNCESPPLERQLIPQASDAYCSWDLGCADTQNVYQTTSGTSRSVPSEPVQCPLSIQNTQLSHANYESNLDISGYVQEHVRESYSNAILCKTKNRGKRTQKVTKLMPALPNFNLSRETSLFDESASNCTGFKNPTFVRTPVSYDMGCIQFQTLPCVEMPSTSFACNNRSENFSIEDSFVCNECEKSTTQRVISAEENKENYGSCLGGQSFHLTNCHRDNRTHKKYTCTVCGKRCIQNNIQNKDPSIDTQIRPFLCKVCGKSFRTKTKLKIHGFVHTKEKPFKCELCDKCFTQKCNLNRHKVIHTNERPFV